MSEISNEGVQFDPLMVKLSKFLGKVLERYQGDGVSFSINNKELEIEDIVSPNGLLHIIAYETSQKAIDVLGKEHKRNLEMETGLKSRPGAPKVIKLDEHYDRFADAGMSGMLRVSESYKSSNKGLDF